MVYPSGFAFATYSVAILPPAPALFSTMTVRFTIGRSFSAKYRTNTSAPLPGGKAQTKRKSWLGYSWARTVPGITPNAAAKAIASHAEYNNDFDLSFMGFL